MEESVHAGGE
jgi:ankyrin repeat protein